MALNEQIAAGGNPAAMSPTPFTYNLPGQGGAFTSQNPLDNVLYTLQGNNVTQFDTNAFVDQYLQSQGIDAGKLGGASWLQVTAPGSDSIWDTSRTYDPVLGSMYQKARELGIPLSNTANNKDSSGVANIQRSALLQNLLKQQGIDMSSLPKYLLGDVLAGLRAQGGGNSSMSSDINLFKSPTGAPTTSTVNTQAPQLASPEQYAAAQAAQQQQLAGVQGMNQVTTTDPNTGAITGVNPTPLVNPAQTGQQAFQSTQQNPNAIPMSGGYVAQTASQTQQNAPGAMQTGGIDPATGQPFTAQQMSILDSLKMDLLGAQHSLTQAGAAPNELSAKYNSMYEQLKGTTTPTTGGEASKQMGSTLPEENNTTVTQDFMQGYGALNSAEKMQYDLLTKAFNTQTTTQTLAQEFAAAMSNTALPAGIPGESLSQEQMKMMDMKKIMDGTEDDIRAEITKSGSVATESQVQALTTARNKTLLKQASYLMDSMTLKADYIKMLMDFTEKDRKQVEDDIDRKLGITEKMVALQDKMTNAAKENLNSIVNNAGYQGLATLFAGDAAGMKNAERTLGLPLGALSNKTFLDLMTADDKKFQFISGTANQQSGVFDPATGTFKAMGGGGPTTGGSGATSTAANKAYFDAFANATIGVGPQSLPGLKKQFDSYMANGDLEGARQYVLGLALERNPAADKTIIVGRQAAFDQMSEVKGLLDSYVAKSGDTNILKGTLEQAANKIGQSSNPDLAYLGSRMTQALINYRRAMSGVAFSEPESKQYASIMPDYKNANVLNAAMINAFQDAIRVNQRASISPYIGGNAVFDALYNTGAQSQLPSDQAMTYNNQILISRNGEKGYITSLDEFNPDTDKFMSIKP